MAFLKPIEIEETGVTAEYWRVTHVQLDRVAGVVEALLHGYRDEAARRAGKSPVQRLSFRFAQDAMEDPYNLNMDDLYRAIRAEASGTDGAGQPLPSMFANADFV